MFPRENRLRHEKDIKTLFANGKSVFDPVCGVKYRRNQLSVSRFAVVVGTKVSKSSVERNRIRRRLREIVRTHLPSIAPGFDVMLLVRPDAKGKTSAELKERLLRSLKKTPVWRAPSPSS